ncbi:MAG: hypothetical protein HY897_17615 [Deltaproteobacteria bacterium]|nr:hypothetical protein [Deltaproteobacteria bacterium]
MGMVESVSRQLAAAAVAPLVLLFGGCHLFLPSVGEEGQPCFEDGTCLAGLVCDSRSVCVNASAVGDGGVATDVGEPRRDGAEGDVPSAPDAADSGSDSGSDTSYPSDASDAGSDAAVDDAGDAGPDTGADMVLQSGGLAGAAGFCENEDYVLNFAVEWNAVTVMETDDLRLQGGAVFGVSQ